VRLRTVLIASTIALLAIAAIVGAGAAWLRYSPRRTPAGQPALSRLDAPALPAFRDAFNASAGSTRVIVLLSPT